MAKRGIPFQLMKLVLEEPQQILDVGTVKIYQSQVDYNDKIQLLRVFVSDLSDPAIVVSVYNTSKINKYWRQI